MNTTYLLILAAIAALFLFMSRRRKKEEKGLIEETYSPTTRIIQVSGMDPTQLQQTIDNVVAQYSDGAPAERPLVDTNGDTATLTFSPHVDYVSLCYWVNFLVYADESDRHRRFQAVGWYPFGQAKQNGVPLPFNNQTVMLYVEPDDSEYDNVSLVTPEGDHYLQPFAINGNLALHPAGTQSYRPCPINKTQETQ